MIPRVGSHRALMLAHLFASQRGVRRQTCARQRITSLTVGNLADQVGGLTGDHRPRVESRLLRRLLGAEPACPALSSTGGVDQRIIDDFVGHQTDKQRRRYRYLYPSTQETIRTVFDQAIRLAAATNFGQRHANADATIAEELQKTKLWFAQVLSEG